MKSYCPHIPTLTTFIQTKLIFLYNLMYFWLYLNGSHALIYLSQNSLPLININTNTKYCKQIVIFPLKGATFSISVPRQHPAPLVNGIFLPTIAVLPVWSGGGVYAVYKSEPLSYTQNIFDSANANMAGYAHINILKFFIMLFMYYDIKTRSKNPCHYRLFLLNV